jgi:pilin isopeptide linkage protein/LPXTG-motif cell wall-anchored protein
MLVNVGTLSEQQAQTIRAAVSDARSAGIPWVLDPVAVGLLRYRTEVCRELLQTPPAMIRGNASEIIALAGAEGALCRGVESMAESAAAISAAQALARRTGAAVLVTGETDYATDGTTTFEGTLVECFAKASEAGGTVTMLEDANGSGNAPYVRNGENDAEGKILFDTIRFPVEGTYILTVSEVAGDLQYVTYDEATFTVTVEVTNENGVLSAQILYPDDAVEFVNTYKEPPTVNPDTGDQAPIMAMMVIMILSAAAVILLLVFKRKQKA